jgi:hypothetical protein
MRTPGRKRVSPRRRSRIGQAEQHEQERQAKAHGWASPVCVEA